MGEFEVFPSIIKVSWLFYHGWSWSLDSSFRSIFQIVKRSEQDLVLATCNSLHSCCLIKNHKTKLTQIIIYWGGKKKRHKIIHPKPNLFGRLSTTPFSFGPTSRPHFADIFFRSLEPQWEKGLGNLFCHTIIIKPISSNLSPFKNDPQVF